GRVELQQRRTELKPLRPFGPAARRVFPFDGEHRRAVLGLPGFLDAQDFLRGKLEEPLDLGNEPLRCELEINFCRHNCLRSSRCQEAHSNSKPGIRHSAFSGPPAPKMRLAETSALTPLPAPQASGQAGGPFPQERGKSLYG